MAAKIVKHLVLPMFDNSAGSKHGRRIGGTKGNSASIHAQSGMVYNELKLSEKLNDTLSMVRSEVMQLRGDLEDE